MRDVFEWLDEGIRNGWCSTTRCCTHEGVPSTVEENAEWEEGGDPCQHIVRLWADGQVEDR